MLLIAFGLAMIALGASQIRFPRLVETLRAFDHGTWIHLGRPPAYAFSQSIAVMTWLLNREFERSPFPEVVQAGKRALGKAALAKTSLLTGVASLSVGFFWTLATV